MTIKTAFNIGQQVRAKGGDIGEVVSIFVDIQKSEDASCIVYDVRHYKEVTGDAEYGCTYFESELSGV